MCGICGFFYKNPRKRISLDILDNMVDRMTRRGPDDRGVFQVDGGALGHRRLTIIDLAGGQQPMISNDGKAAIVTNGEIYNYHELRKDYLKEVQFESTSDTEVLLYLLKIKGLDAIPLLNGMFAFAFWDIDHDKLILARDPVGQKPLFYFLGKDSFVFASDLSSLALHPDVPLDIDTESLAYYLFFEGYPHPHSPFKGVKKLSPGHFMILDLRQWTIRIEKYWNNILRTDIDPHISEKDYINMFTEKIAEAMDRHLRADVDIGIYLSGGLDSPSMVKAASSIRGGDAIRTFTIKHEIESYDESNEAREVASYYGTRHHERLLREEDFLSDVDYLLRNIDEPIADPGFLALYQVAKFSREFVKVVISGNGGDEFYAGYAPFHALNAYKWAHSLLPEALVKLLRRLAMIPKAEHGYMNNVFKVQRFLRGVSSHPAELLMQWIGSFNHDEIKNVLNKDIELDCLHIEGKYGAPSLYKELYLEFEKLGSLDVFLNLLNTFQRFYLPTCICNHSDKASMMVSQELRSPFLDNEVMLLANHMANKMKYNDRQTKFILRKYLQSDSHGAAGRQKRGFTVPLASWLTSALKPWANEILDPIQLSKDGLFNVHAVRKLWNEHQERKANNAKSLWTIIVFQHWFHSVRSNLKSERIIKSVDNSNVN